MVVIQSGGEPPESRRWGVGNNGKRGESDHTFTRSARIQPQSAAYDPGFTKTGPACPPGSGWLQTAETSPGPGFTSVPTLGDPFFLTRL